MARPKKTKTTSIFATNFKKILQERQLNLKMAADLMGLPYSTVVDWSNGTAPSDIEAIGTFCRKLGIDFAWLMLNEPQKAPDPSQLPLEALFEEQESGFEGIYRVKAVKLVRKKGEKV